MLSVIKEENKLLTTVGRMKTGQIGRFKNRAKVKYATPLDGGLIMKCYGGLVVSLITGATWSDCCEDLRVDLLEEGSSLEYTR